MIATLDTCDYRKRRRTRTFRVALLASLVAVGTLPPGELPAFGRTKSRDLRSIPAVALLESSNSAAVGDINGDGEEDVVTGDCYAHEDAGQTDVIFGPFSPGLFDLEESPERGFPISGATQEDGACFVSQVGDVNGDDLDDVVVGAPVAGNNDRDLSGTAYVVFGKEDTDPVDLADFDAGTQSEQGFRIDGAYEFSLTGQHLAHAGDVNGDGYDDVYVGAVFADAAYVVFGGDVNTNVDLLTFHLNVQGPRGFRIHAPGSESNSAFEIGGLGDVNGDGLADVGVGIVRDFHGKPGSAYVVFGKADPMPVDVTALAGAGFRIKGAHRGDTLGLAITGTGDMNADGLADIVVGAPHWRGCCRGKAYVLWGKEDGDPIGTRALAGKGFKIKGPLGDGSRIKGSGWVVRDTFGFAVTGLSDVNGDSVPDIAIGAPLVTYNGRPGAGSVFVIYGQKREQTVKAADLANGGFRIDGRKRGASTGYQLDSFADVTGDGLADLLIGAPSIGGVQPKRAYIVPGTGSW